MHEFGFNARGAFSYETTLGKGFGSVVLANIFYQFPSGDFSYKVDGSGNTVLDNQGLNNAVNNGLLYSGRGIELGATNDVDIPIHHTLGANQFSTDFQVTRADELGTFTSVTGVGFNASVTTIGTDAGKPNYSWQNDVAFDAGSIVKISFDIVVNSGTAVLQFVRSQLGTVIIPVETLTTGSYEYEVVAGSTNNSIASYITISGTNLYDVSVTNFKSEQITNPNSYLTYYDFTDGLVTLGNSVDGGSSDNLEKVINGDFSDGLTNWTAIGGDTYSYITSEHLSLDTTLSGADTTVGRRYNLSGLVVGKTYSIKYDKLDGTSDQQYRVVVGSTVVSDYANDTSTGTYIFDFVATASASTIDIYKFNGHIGIVNIDNISFRQILPISTKYTLNTKTVNNIITHTTPWSASDWTKINNNPNLIGKLALETLGATKTIPELDMVMDAGASADSYYMCSENVSPYIADSRSTYSSSNDALYSEEFDNAYWPKSDVTVTANTTTAPDGTLTADSLIETATTANHLINKANVFPLVGERVLSIYAKANTRNWIRVQTQSPSNSWVNVNLSTGTVGLTGGSEDYFNIENVGNGWYRISVGYTPTSTSGIQIFIIDSDRGGASPSYLGDGTSNIYIWGAQSEEGKLPTEYTQTTTTIASGTPIETKSIANYTETIRTNADLQQKGIQTTAFVTDGVGVPTAYSSNLLQFSGDGRYVDTKFIPSASEDFSIEVVAYQDSTRYIFSSGSAFGENIVWLLSNPANFIIFIGTKSATFNIPNDGLPHHIVVTYQASTKGFDISIDNSAPLSNTNVSFVSPLNSMYLGQRRDLNSTYSATMPQGYYAVYNRILSSDEKLKSYNKAKAIYPTIP